MYGKDILQVISNSTQNISAIHWNLSEVLHLRAQECFETPSGIKFNPTIHEEYWISYLLSRIICKYIFIQQFCVVGMFKHMIEQKLFQKHSPALKSKNSYK